MKKKFKKRLKIKLKKMEKLKKEKKDYYNRYSWCTIEDTKKKKHNDKKTEIRLKI